MEINYTPERTGTEFMSSEAKRRLIMGPVGSGKSTVCIMEIARRCSEITPCLDGTRRSRWVIVRNTMPQLKQTTLKTWLQWFPDGQAGRWRADDKTFILEFGDVKAEVIFLALDTPEDQSRLLSLELTGGYFNETRETPFELIGALFSRCGRYPSKAMHPDPYWYGVIMDTNPPSQDHWIHQTFEIDRPEGWSIFKQPGGLDVDAENLAWLQSGYYEDMMSGAPSQDWIDVHVHGKYGRSVSGKPVYEKSWNEKFHVSLATLRPINSRNYPVYIGMDFGRNPSAVIGQRNPSGQLCVFATLREDNCGLERFLRATLKPWLAKNLPGALVIVIGDPAGGAKSQINDDSCFSILKKEGFQAVPAPTNAIDTRIAAVEGLLFQHIDGKPALIVDPACRSLIVGFNSGYRYKKRRDQTFESSPEKNVMSHEADAMQYLALGSGSAAASLVAGRTAKRPVVTAKAAGWC